MSRCVPRKRTLSSGLSFQHECTFDEFVTAYHTFTLLALFESNGLRYQHISRIEDVLAGPMLKSA
jgi:hypothetical protein